MRCNVFIHNAEWFFLAAWLATTVAFIVVIHQRDESRREAEERGYEIHRLRHGGK